MRTTRFFLTTAAIISLSVPAFAQNATQVQQQQTEAASAGQAAKTNAATQGQAQKTEAATAGQAQKTQSATQDQAQKTQAAAQKQAEATAAAVQQQPGQPQLNLPSLYNNQPISNGGAVLYGLGSAAGTATAPAPIYNTGTPNNPAAASSPAEKQLQDLFNTIDRDHSGMISKTEFSMYYSSPPDDPRFDGYDVNRDMMISFFEFRGPNVSGASVSVPSH